MSENSRPKPGRGRTRRQFLRDVAATGAGLAAASLSYEGGELAAEAATSIAVGKAVKTSAAPRAVHLRVNHQVYDVPLDPRVTLLDALRDHCGLHGSKKGCDHGQCGACTVLADGKRINACLALAVAYEGKAITTVEGLADGDRLHPVQQAFLDHDAFQCGYCTPGQICSATGMLLEGKPATDDEIRERMSGNICRCGAYPNIVDAIRDVRDAGVSVTPPFRPTTPGHRPAPSWEGA